MLLYYRMLLLLVFLSVLFCLNQGARFSTKSIDIVGDVKDLLIRDKRNGDLTQCGDIVGKIISLLECGPFPFSPNSHLQYSVDYAMGNFGIFLECDRYYKTAEKLNSSKVECKNKKWIYNKIDCEEISCHPLTVPFNGHMTTTNNTFNTTVYFWCSNGYSIKGDDKLFCKENGFWDMIPPTCEVSNCQPLTPPLNGFISSQHKTPTNQTVTFSCKSDYSLMGNALLTCLADRRWDYPAPVCTKTCFVPNVPESQGVRSVPKLRELKVGSLIQQGQRVIFSCKSGHVASYSGLSTCIGGTLKPPIRCQKMCTAWHVANGRYTLLDDSLTIEYSCFPGYQLVGQRQLSCTSNLTWDGEIPLCTKLCTLTDKNDVLSFRKKETHELIPFGTQIVERTQVYFLCKFGNQLDGTITTCHDGKLSPSTCQRSRVRHGFLEVLDNKRNWYRICSTDRDVCELFGLTETFDRPCARCFDLDLDTYIMNSTIILNAPLFRGKSCAGCG